MTHKKQSSLRFWDALRWHFCLLYQKCTCWRGKRIIHIFKQDCGKIYWVNNIFANSKKNLRYKTCYTLFYLTDFISVQNCPDLETIVWHRLKSTTALMIIWYPFNIFVGFQDSFLRILSIEYIWRSTTTNAWEQMHWNVLHCLISLHHKYNAPELTCLLNRAWIKGTPPFGEPETKQLLAIPTSRFLKMTKYAEAFLKL